VRLLAWLAPLLIVLVGGGVFALVYFWPSAKSDDPTATLVLTSDQTTGSATTTSMDSDDLQSAGWSPPAATSYTPTTEAVVWYTGFEAHVRQVLVDIQAHGVRNFYANIGPEDPNYSVYQEPVRRWDAGVRVVNLEEVGTTPSSESNNVQLNTD
jgi:hypothetical protein